MSVRSYDIREVSEMLAAKAEDVCLWLLPGGRRNGHEWCVGSVTGEAGDSLRVNLAGKAGLWRDFAADEKGGDLIDLLMAVHGLSKREAVMEAKDWLGLREESPNFATRKATYKRPDKPSGMTAPDLETRTWFGARFLSDETVKAFKIGQIITDKGHVAVFPYLRDGELVFLKFRPLADKKGMWTSKDSEPCLFGWQTIPDGARQVILTEGEPDAMAFYDAGYPALSVPRGGGDGEKQDGWINAEWDRLQLFDTIFLALDNDEQGQAATAHILRRLGAHRCRLVDFGKYKDANEALLAGADFGAMLHNARTMDPEELHAATEYLDEMFDYFERGGDCLDGTPLPWDKTQDRIRIRPGETTIWAGWNGQGKSQVAGHVCNGSLAAGERWCVFSGEFRPHKLMARLSRQASATNAPSKGVHGPGLTRLYGDGLWIFDTPGQSKKADRILEVFEYAFRRYGVTNFLVDSLAKCGMAEDDYNGQKAFVERLSDFARSCNVHVHVVCHAKKGKDEKDDSPPDKFDVKGTGGITDMADNVMMVWRNKAKEERMSAMTTRESRENLRRHEPDALVICCKQRNGTGWEGRVKLWFDPASLQYLEEPEKWAVRYAK